MLVSLPPPSAPSSSSRSLPLPNSDGTSDAFLHLNEVGASKQRMEAALAQAEARVESAAIKIQAAHRGKQTRETKHWGRLLLLLEKAQNKAPVTLADAICMPRRAADRRRQRPSQFLSRQTKQHPCAPQ